MIVYHGSNTAVDIPDVLRSQRNLDFGKGFYVTTVKLQAERWAKRKCSLLRCGLPTVSIYDMSDLGGLHLLDLSNDLSKWLVFVCQCRDGSAVYKSYDVIKGRVADDNVFRVVDMFKRGIWDEARALQEIKVYDTYDQIAFITQSSADASLLFTESYGVEP